MMITWVTMAYTNYTIVEYNKAGFPLTLQKSGSITKFTDGGSAHLVRYIHRVKLTGLVPAQRYGRSSFSSLQFQIKEMKGCCLTLRLSRDLKVDCEI